MLDAAVVGAGPNGLAAAITLAAAGRRVRVYEAASTAGGGCRTAELTLPGFRHDVCAAVLALGQASPFLCDVDLDALGVRLCTPEIAFAHPLDDGRAAAVYPDFDQTVAGLGPDGAAWRRLVGPLARRAGDVLPDVLGDLRHVPRHPLLLARFGVPGLLPVSILARTAFRTDVGRALLAGAGAHSVRRLSAPLTSAFALTLAMSAHLGGWPVVEGGSGQLTAALTRRLGELGGELVCDHPVRRLTDLPPACAVLLDVTPRQLLELAGPTLPPRYRRTLRRFRYGAGVFKIDYALSGPVPWRADECRRAATVHVGGTLDQIAASEAEVEAGRHSDRPFVLVVQPSVIDPTRAPAGQHTLWAYCHVPNGSTLDRTAVIDAQLERFAPGFGELVLARHTRTAVQYEDYDANYVGGDINGGRAGIYQSFLGPAPRLSAVSRYRTPLPGVYLCSSSTPPGGGVHGMCGMNAAQEVLARELAG